MLLIIFPSQMLHLQNNFVFKAGFWRVARPWICGEIHGCANSFLVDRVRLEENSCDVWCDARSLEMIIVVVVCGSHVCTLHIHPYKHNCLSSLQRQGPPDAPVLHNSPSVESLKVDKVLRIILAPRRMVW